MKKNLKSCGDMLSLISKSIYSKILLVGEWLHQRMQQKSKLLVAWWIIIIFRPLDFSSRHFEMDLHCFLTVFTFMCSPLCMGKRRNCNRSPLKASVEDPCAVFTWTKYKTKMRLDMTWLNKINLNRNKLKKYCFGSLWTLSCCSVRNLEICILNFTKMKEGEILLKHICIFLFLFFLFCFIFLY